MTRMDDIAQAARLSKGGLYAHFSSQQALLQHLLEPLRERPLHQALLLRLLRP